jgi:hypothetical protein
VPYSYAGLWIGLFAWRWHLGPHDPGPIPKSGGRDPQPPGFTPMNSTKNSTDRTSNLSKLGWRIPRFSRYGIKFPVFVISPSQINFMKHEFVSRLILNGTSAFDRIIVFCNIGLLYIYQVIAWAIIGVIELLLSMDRLFTRFQSFSDKF